MQEMEILYISPLISRKKLDIIHQKTNKGPGYAVQKFNRLIAKGLVYNGVAVKSLSIPPLPYSLSRAIWCNYPCEIEDGIQYRYFPFLNIPIIKHVCIFLYAFIYVLFWGRQKHNERCLICDVLTISACMGAVLAAKINKLLTVGIMTDMPGLMVDLNNKSFFIQLASYLNRWYLSKFRSYVFLTEQMNIVNKNNCPYIVMEGLVDSEMRVSKNNGKYEKTIIIYAGGLDERYGLKMLVEGFMLVNIKDTELWLYGGGPFVDKILEYYKQDSRIIYKGIQPNIEVVNAETKATLLVNPRPTTEDFTKYSFPSKNMEYMVSGTPVLTTMLPGMPEEYNQYVYLFDRGESVKGYAEVLNHVLSLPKDELVVKGERARQWIMENKNNVRQTERIIRLITKK